MQHGETLEQPLSLAEFERLSEEDGYRIELVKGRIVREPLPNAEHGWLTSELFGRIHAHARKYGPGLALIETGFLLSDEPPTVRGPDIAFIAEENLPEEGIPFGFWRVPPDLAVEVLSPSNTAADIQEKVLEYLAAGTGLVWVVDPRTRSVASYRGRKDVQLLTEDDTLDGGDVLPGFTLPISHLFARPAIGPRG